MPIETSPSGTISITGESIQDYRFLLGLNAIAFEVNTGMKMTRGFSPKNFAAEYGYTGSSNKKTVLKWLVKASGFEVKPGSPVDKALNG